MSDYDESLVLTYEDAKRVAISFAIEGIDVSPDDLPEGLIPLNN